MKKIKKVKNAIGLVGKIVNDITSQKEDEVLNVKSIVDYVNNYIVSGKDGWSIYGNHDLNNIVKSGFYYITDAINGPNSSELWGYILVINHSNISGYCVQIFFPVAKDTSYFYFRKQHTNVWGKWIKVSGTAVN